MKVTVTGADAGFETAVRVRRRRRRKSPVGSKAKSPKPVTFCGVYYSRDGVLPGPVNAVDPQLPRSTRHCRDSDATEIGLFNAHSIRKLDARQSRTVAHPATPQPLVAVWSRAYSKLFFRINCALRIKKCAPRISSGIYFLSTS